MPKEQPQPLPFPSQMDRIKRRVLSDLGMISPHLNEDDPFFGEVLNQLLGSSKRARMAYDVLTNKGEEMLAAARDAPIRAQAKQEIKMLAGHYLPPEFHPPGFMETPVPVKESLHLNVVTARAYTQGGTQEDNSYIEKVTQAIYHLEDYMVANHPEMDGVIARVWEQTPISSNFAAFRLVLMDEYDEMQRASNPEHVPWYQRKFGLSEIKN